jgi:hypothetical protein
MIWERNLDTWKRGVASTTWCTCMGITSRCCGIDTAPDALAAAPRTATVDFQAGDVYALAYPDAPSTWCTHWA